MIGMIGSWCNDDNDDNLKCSCCAFPKVWKDDHALAHHIWIWAGSQLRWPEIMAACWHMGHAAGGIWHAAGGIWLCPIKSQMMAWVINSKTVINIPGNNIKSRSIWSDMVRFPDLRCSQNLETWTPLPPRPVVHALAHASGATKAFFVGDKALCVHLFSAFQMFTAVQKHQSLQSLQWTITPKMWWIVYPLISTSATDSFREPSLELALDLGVGWTRIISNVSEWVGKFEPNRS